MPARHFVKYTFFKVDPAWRRRAPEQRAQDKREFLAACDDFAAERLLRSFSLVGTRGDADLLLSVQAANLERIHEFHVVLAQSGLVAWCSTPYSYLAMTKPSEYSDESRLEVRPGHSRYLFVYPFVKTRAWYALPAPERRRIMQEHIRLGREYPSIDLNTSYSFGLDDQEFVVAFETDDPAAFLDLVQRLRTTESSSYTQHDTPTFTCIATSVERALNALDGESRGAGRCLSAPRGRAPARRRPGAGARDRAIEDGEGPGESRRAARPDDHYGALVRAIVGQQLSTKAARAIYTRLNDRFGGRPPTPAEILAEEPEELRAAAGLSRAKVGFLRSLAEHVPTGASTSTADRPRRRRRDRARRRQGTRRLERAHVPDLPPRAARRPARRRPRRAPRDHERLRAARAPVAGRDDPHRRALAPAPLDGVALPVALAGRDAGLGRRRHVYMAAGTAHRSGRSGWFSPRRSERKNARR